MLSSELESDLCTQRLRISPEVKSRKVRQAFQPAMKRNNSAWKGWRTLFKVKTHRLTCSDSGTRWT